MMNETTKKSSMLLRRVYSDPKYASSISDRLFPTSISQQQGQFLQAILNQRKPKLMLELGFGYGVSSLWFATAEYKPKKHLIVDPQRIPARKDVIYKLLQQHKHIIFEEKMSSQQFLANVEYQREKVDFIFIDADEKFDGVMTDLYFATRCLQPNGIIFVIFKK